MSEALLDLPEDPEDGESLADWAEAVMFLEERTTMPRGELKRRLSERRGDFEVGLLLKEVRARRRRVGDSYPFEPEEPGLVRRDGIDPTLYEFLLWASFPQSPVRVSHDYTEIDAFFDRIVLRALCAYLGPISTGVRFGTPASDGRPRGFADALVWLADLMDVSSTGSLPPNDDKNDAGVDVIVWLAFPDRRSDFLVAIAQCTMRDKWMDKAAELFAAAKSWGGGWISLGKEPVTALAVPFSMSSSEPRFPELRGLVNVVLDRDRLCALAVEPPPSDRNAVRDWASRMRADLLKGEPAPNTKSKATKLT